MVEIPRPTNDEVEKYLESWKHLDKYVYQEKSLDKLFFKLIPDNKVMEDILIKCSALNDFYSTNIFSICPVAKHIYELDIDERLSRGDLTLVEDIANVKDLNKRFYSFATKYCSHHNPDSFPIYDNYVDRVLRYFRKKDNFADFKNKDLKDYVLFNEILHKFASYYSLEKYSLKDLDRYLWQLGKEYFKRKF